MRKKKKDKSSLEVNLLGVVVQKHVWAKTDPPLRIRRLLLHMYGGQGGVHPSSSAQTKGSRTPSRADPTSSTIPHAERPSMETPNAFEQDVIQISRNWNWIVHQRSTLNLSMWAR